jgi:hypothetical protein
MRRMNENEEEEEEKEGGKRKGKRRGNKRRKGSQIFCKKKLCKGTLGADSTFVGIVFTKKVEVFPY